MGKCVYLLFDKESQSISTLQSKIKLEKGKERIICSNVRKKEINKEN